MFKQKIMWKYMKINELHITNEKKKKEKHKHIQYMWKVHEMCET